MPAEAFQIEKPDVMATFFITGKDPAKSQLVDSKFIRTFFLNRNFFGIVF